MIPCDQVIAKLWEYLDEELAAGDAARIQAHLDACSHCYPHYDFERTYLLFVQRTKEQSIPPGLRSRVFEMILEEDGRKEGRRIAGVKDLLRRFLRRR